MVKQKIRIYANTAADAVTFPGEMDHVAEGLVPVSEFGRWFQFTSGLALLNLLRRQRKN